MSKLSAQDVESEELYDIDIGDDDYGFILGPDGELKSIFLPENMPFVPPKKIQKLLKLLGIKDIDNISGEETLH